MKRSSGSGGGGGSCAGGSGSSVNPKHKPRQYVQVPDDKMSAGYVFEKNAHADIAANYEENSFVIFRVLTPKQCDELILWIWSKRHPEAAVEGRSENRAVREGRPRA